MASQGHRRISVEDSRGLRMPIAAIAAIARGLLHYIATPRHFEAIFSNKGLLQPIAEKIDYYTASANFKRIPPEAHGIQGGFLRDAPRHLQCAENL